MVENHVNSLKVHFNFFILNAVYFKYNSKRLGH